MRRVLPAMLFGVLLAAPSPAQELRALLLAEPLQVKSSVLGEARTVVVSLPASYASGQERFPVLYLLDGGAHLVHTRATADFLATNDLIPPLIIVAILQVDRTRELTPTRVNAEIDGGRTYRYPNSGGSLRFLDFIEKELVPLIEARYRTQPFRVLCGHSFGGLLAVTAAVTRPSLFQGIVATSPSLDWDRGFANKRARSFLEQTKAARLSLFLTMASEGKAMQDGLTDLEKLLAAARVPGLRWSVLRMPDEDHGSTVLRSHYHGLRMIFDGWRLPPDLKAEPAKIGPEDVNEHYAKLSERLGFAVPHRQEQVARLCAAAIERGDVGRALGLCGLNAKVYAGVASVQYALGRAQEIAGMLDEAVHSYERAIDAGAKSNDSLVGAYRERLLALKATLK